MISVPSLAAWLSAFSGGGSLVSEIYKGRESVLKNIIAGLCLGSSFCLADVGHLVAKLDDEPLGGLAADAGDAG